MKKPLANIGILLLLIIAMPPLFFTSYEVSNYYQNEQMIDSIYTSQLESVIFSVNQYSDDIVSGWANQIEQDIQNADTSAAAFVSAFIKRNVSIRTVFFMCSGKQNSFHTLNTSRAFKTSGDSIFNGVLENNVAMIERLKQYLEAGYRKIQPVETGLPGYSLFLFACRDSGGSTGICALLADSKKFISENLGTKIQSVARDKFYLSAFELDSETEIYSSDLRKVSGKNFEHKQKLWLLPGYQLGIRLKGETIEDMVQERMWTNIWLIIIMDLILILAAFFVYRGVHQQMKLAQLKSEFVSNVSHEIRTPLAIINMYSETLEMGRIKDESKKMEYYRVIHNETNRLSGIVNKILNFSKIESGNREMKFTETNINMLLQQIIQNYQHHFKNEGLICNFYPAGHLPLINIDPDAITDATINLIDNAIKYSTDKKQIDISTGTDGNNIFIEVKDYGIGIEEKYQKLVFDKFFRVTKGNLAHKAKGSGIGLSIVKQIIIAHQGSIGLVSKAGEGSKFRLNFPIHKT
ncbi:MAG: HAMP domain-containing histidine kinase [Bacteroidales bacterium]|nr:HAMP domain-containing histidine kinase [Bacteroidales bacterium]